jgi:hypothetical protein
VPVITPTLSAFICFKWYNADKGFGFICRPGGGNDV